MRATRRSCSAHRRTETARITQRREVDAWRSLRLHVLRRFAARAVGLRWTDALVQTIVADLAPDDSFATLIGPLRRVPRRQWPRALAVAVALRHSWRRDGLTRLARRLHVSLARTTPGRHPRPSRDRLSGSAQRGQGSPHRSDPGRRS